MWKVIIFDIVKNITQPIQVMCFNAELHTLYNSCEGLARAFLERINTVSKNRVILTCIHSFTRYLQLPHKQKKDMRQKPSMMFQRPLTMAET